MGDTSTQLEKMGRELKCPICLSLLNSAVSLSCNHVFCNSCIVTSMKSGSNCPVCKVPYRRREVRAAPHMDNLVSIYKSMEVASGISIFLTQNEPSAALSDKEREVEVDPICGEKVTGGIFQDRADNQGTSKRKRLRRTTKSNLELSDPVAVKPSFPTKKRVQVAKYPLPETPTPPAKSEGELVNNSCIQLKDCTVVLKEKGPVLSPFFWLREEEDEEKSTQHTDGDAYITPPDVPSFSDIMDSDDKSSSQSSPTGEVHDKTGGVDFLDSEMFEWTQRACSPELLPSPLRTQVADNVESDQIKERKMGAYPQVANTNEEMYTEHAKYVNYEQENGIVGEGHPKESSPRIVNTTNLVGNGKLKKRGMTAKSITIKKCARRVKGQGSGVHVDSREESANVAQKKTNSSNGVSSIMENTRKRRKKVGLGTCATETRAENVLDVSVRAEILDRGGKGMVFELAALGKEGSGEELNLKKTGITCQKLNNQCSLKSKSENTGSSEVNKLKNGSIVQNQTNEDTTLQSSFISVCMSDDKKTSDLKEKPSKSSRKVNSVLNSKCNIESRCRKRMKVSFSGFLKDGLIDDNEEDHSNVSAEETQTTNTVQGSTGVRVLDETSRMKKPLEKQGVVLRKCQTPDKIQCSFCHSSEASEASGEMIHYYNGRPVAADYNGGSKVIHSHRNCTEWAPNVYFGDDTAINLEAELARSRRIKCCCCGLKGAALGCYEKSCRKSFHVPCAKLISQCRWDTDNFVILCPLHASSKLPNESSRTQESRKKCISKKESNNQCNEVAVRNDIGRTYSWNSSQKKLVVCCSALTVEEREIVSEFERLSKVTVLKKWDSSVTHVIASTDEKGAGRRTLKYLMGILDGKWILSVEWVKACMKAMKPVDEEQYEIVIDVHGIRGGPRSGRLRVLNKLPKPFDGLKFYFMGGFVSSYKGYIQDLIIAAGGTILHRKPISGYQEAFLPGPSTSSTLIIYSLEVPDKCDLSKKNMILNSGQSEAEVLANSTGAKAVSNSWVLNSIAACKLQSYAE